MDRETTDLVLANRSFLYALLARAYAEEPDAAFAEAFASEHACEEMALVESAQTLDIVALHAQLAAGLSRPGSVQDAAREYVRLFVGPGTLKADPWETVLLTGRRSLFQPGVLDVRDAYREAGFQPVRVREVPDDFIGLELDFLAKLAQRALERHGAEDQTWFEDLRRSRAFLDDHLLKWVDSLANAIQAGYGECFYSGLTRLASLVAKRDLMLVREVLR